jgi:hypothetical protein
MRAISKALIAVVAAAVLATGVAAETMPISPLEKTAPCHRHHAPNPLPSSHQCCRGVPASHIVKGIREDNPTTAVVADCEIVEPFAATPVVQSIKPRPSQPGESFGITPLRI